MGRGGMHKDKIFWMQLNLNNRVKMVVKEEKLKRGLKRELKRELRLIVEPKRELKRELRLIVELKRELRLIVEPKRELKEINLKLYPYI